jgi:hypothetical protein
VVQLIRVQNPRTLLGKSIEIAIDNVYNVYFMYTNHENGTLHFIIWRVLFHSRHILDTVFIIRPMARFE